MRNRTSLLLTLLTLTLLWIASAWPALSQTSPTYVWTNFVGRPGGGPGRADGTGSAARFNNPYGVAVDSAGNVFVADGQNSTIRKVTPAGVVTTLAGSAGVSGTNDGTGSAARFNGPSGVAVDSTGNVLVADEQNSTIRKVTSAGVVTTLAGSAGYSGTSDGTGSAARFCDPTGVAVDSAGNVFVADCGNCTIRRVTAAGVVTTLAGSAGYYGTSDGTGSAARFCDPAGVAVDGVGNVFVADSGNNTIRRVTSAGVVTTLAGSAGYYGTSDGTGSAARFCDPAGVAVDSVGNVFVADTFNSTIRQVTSVGVVTTLVGLAGSDGSADGTGNAARFLQPQGVAVDRAGNVLVADTRNNTIRTVTRAGVVTTLAGLALQFNWPTGVAVDSAGNVFVADEANQTIRMVTSAGVVTTLAGSTLCAGGNDGTGGAAHFLWPVGVAVDNAGNVFVADSGNDTIRKVSPAGVVTTLAGSVDSFGTNDGTGSAARFGVRVGNASYGPCGVAVDSAGNVFVADVGNNTVRKVTPGGLVTTLAGLPLDNNGDGWPDGGYADGTGSVARFYHPCGVAVDSAGNVFVADTANQTIRKVTSAGVVTTLAGSPGSSGSVDGTGSAARFYNPQGVAVDSAGNVFVGDSGNDTIRKVSPAGVVTTVGGSPGVLGWLDGTDGAARFNYPTGIAVDSAGNLFVADKDNNAIRKGWPTSGGVGVTITVPPQSQIVNAGATVIFSVAATGTGQLSYQWRFNGTDIAGATSATLTLNSVSAGNDGAYSVVVWNAIDSVVSAPASLAVLTDGANGTQPAQTSVQIAPTKPTGADSLVIVTHGWEPKGPLADISWITGMADAIRARVDPAKWVVMPFDWVGAAWFPDPDVALISGVAVGGLYAKLRLVPQRWQHVHFIGHSAGSAVIEAMAKELKSASNPPEIHETFLDPYTEFITLAGQQVYGANADWSDCYFVNDWTGASTGGGLADAFNVDVSWVDPDHTQTPIPCPSSTADSTPPLLDNICGYQAWSSHGYLVDFYSNSIANALPTCAAGYGFPLSKEGGGWANRGNYPPNSANPLVLCGLPSIPQNLFPVNIGQPFQFNLMPSSTSSFGVSFTGVGGATFSAVSSQFPPPGPRPLDVSTNAPAWLALGVRVTNTINFVRFDSGFTDTNGSQGLMTVYWNTNQIGLIDERAATPGLQTYRFPLPAPPVSSGLYTLSFRLDVFTNTESSITVTNVATGFVGITQPISLNMLLMGSNNTPVLKLAAAAGYNYLVQSSTNLVDWSPTALLVNTNGAVLFADPAVTNRGARFYRAMMP